MNVQHSSRTDRWYTPIPIIEKVERVLGRIELDPASDAFGQVRIGAMRYIDEGDDGLTTSWGEEPLSIFLNPPGGVTKGRSRMRLFWEKLMRHRETVGIKHAVFLAFSAEALQRTQGREVPSMMQFPICVPSKRIRFDAWGGLSGAAPSHSNVIVYVPGQWDRTDEFIRVFSSLGNVKR